MGSLRWFEESISGEPKVRMLTENVSLLSIAMEQGKGIGS